MFFKKSRSRTENLFQQGGLSSSLNDDDDDVYVTTTRARITIKAAFDGTEYYEPNELNAFINDNLARRCIHSTGASANDIYDMYQYYDFRKCSLD